MAPLLQDSGDIMVLLTVLAECLDERPKQMLHNISLWADAGHRVSVQLVSADLDRVYIGFRQVSL